MTFKILGRLTNVKAPKDENPILTTTPSKGIVKINAPAAKLMGYGVGQYVTIIVAETEKGKGMYVTQGAEGTENTNQIGSKLSPSTSGTAGGTLQFSSENAWKELGGNTSKRLIFNIGSTPVENDGQKYWELSFDREEDKQVREKADKVGE